MYVRKTDGLYSSCLRSSPLSPILSDSPLSARIYLASCMRQLYVAQVFGQIILSFVACICTRNRFVDGRRSAYPRGRHRGRGTGRLKVEGSERNDFRFVELYIRGKTLKSELRQHIWKEGTASPRSCDV